MCRVFWLSAIVSGVHCRLLMCDVAVAVKTTRRRIYLFIFISKNQRIPLLTPLRPFFSAAVLNRSSAMVSGYAILTSGIGCIFGKGSAAETGGY